MRVELEKVRKSHDLPGGGGFITVLHDIDLVLENGERCLVTGCSGSGKTSLLDIIGGLAWPTSGSVRLDGRELSGCGSWYRGKIAHACQEPVFIPELTVLENLLLPAFRSPDRETAGRGERLLDAFGLAEVFDFYPVALSVGEKQRLSLARALLPSPRLLILDEPLACLDRTWSERAIELVMQEVRDARATLVIASQSPIVGDGFFRPVRLHRGKVIEHDNDDY